MHLDLISDEVKILRLLRGSPRVVNLVDTYETSSKFVMILELVMGGELFDKIVSKGFYSESDATHLIRQILEGIAYCHNRGVVHRDLKPENLLCETADADDLSDVKITDFGIAQVLKPGQTLSGRYGSPLYMAPEIVEGREYTSKVDMWSLGVISFVLLGGYPPFAEVEGRPSLEDQITFGLYSFEEESWQDVTERAKDFVTKLLITDPERRLTAEQALMHPIFSASVRGSTMNRNTVLDKIKRYNARRKFRGAALAIMAQNKMHQIFGMAQKIKEGIQAEMKKSASSESVSLSAHSAESTVVDDSVRTVRLFPRSGRAVILEKRLHVDVSSTGSVTIKDLPHHVNPSSFHIHSLADPTAFCQSLRLDRKNGVATAKLSKSDIFGKASDFQIFYETTSISCRISYHGVLSADQVALTTTGSYVITNDTGRSMKFDTVLVHYAGEEHDLKLSAPMVIDDGESVCENFLESSVYAVSVQTSPDVAVKVVLDNGIILTLQASATPKAKIPITNLPSGAISVYQSHKNQKRRPQVQLMSAGALHNLAEEKAERQLAKQKSAKTVLGLPKRESSKKLVKAHSVKQVRPKPSEVSFFKDDAAAKPSGATSLSVPAFSPKKEKEGKDKKKK
eukprot:TRINITY_DN1354_c0_g1_i2.p1 TRINITY_DN1354_c0_g1~~TRINITY_DN1354_c0_g1_i2.p1  ORF type:complete len:624 (-),score=108.57 TRINITY_DN1354_c0_g1_i2:53-1924(-)